MPVRAWHRREAMPRILISALLAGSFGVARGFLDKKYNLDQKPQIQEALDFAKPGCPTGLVLDIGANGGKESLAARRAGYEVVAVECLRKEFFKLSMTPNITRDAKIHLLYGCASDKVSVSWLSEAGASSSLHPEAVAHDHEQEVFKKEGSKIRSVLTFPMDPIIENWSPPQPVCVFKIDTQGHVSDIAAALIKA